MDRASAAARHDARLNFSRDHQAVLLAVARELSSLPSVLKGGSALIFGYGLHRFSEDLDYNSRESLSLQSKATSAISVIGGLVTDFTIHKDTETTKRYLVTYQYGSIESHRFKIETSFRDQIQESSTVMRNGIRVFHIDVLAQHKIRAINGRTAPRDLQDICFILENFNADISEDTRRSIGALVEDGGLNLLGRYASAYEDDNEYVEADLMTSIELLQKNWRK